MADQDSGGLRMVGVFTLTAGPLAPHGGFRQCRVMATSSGAIVLAPMDSDIFGALIRTVSAEQLGCILESFYPRPQPEEANG